MFDVRNNVSINRFLIVLLFLIGLNVSTNAATLDVGKGKTYSSIQAAVDASFCGDTIDIYTGTYTENVVVDINCLSSEPLTIKAVEPDVIVNANQKGNGFLIGSLSDKSYHSHGNVVLDGQSYGIEFINVGKSTVNENEEYAAVFARWADDVSIKNVSVTSAVGGSCILEDYVGSHVDAVGIHFGEGHLVDNLTVNAYTGLSYGIFVVGVIPDSNDKGITIKNSNIQGVCKMNLYLNWIENSLIEKNYFNYSYRGEKESYAPVYLKNSRKSTFRYNVVEQSGWAHAILKFFDQNNNIIESHQIYNNILVDLGGHTRGAIDLDNGASDIHFTNNIIDHPSTIIYTHDNDNNSLSFENNIFQDATLHDSLNATNSSITQSGNINISATFTGLGNKPSPYYIPDQSSPAIDTGKEIIGYIGTDFDGNKIPYGIGIDIGPFEFYTPGQTTDNVPPSPPTLISLD